MLEAFYPDIIDPNCNIYIKYSILVGLNEISIFPSTTKVELFLKPNIHGIYTSLASHLRSLGDYDTQTQLLEFLLHVIPAARRKDFVEEYIHHGLSNPFCSIIGQQFELAARHFLNLINPIDSVTQTVFSIPCISVRLCGHELTCQTTALKSSNEPSWVDFNLIPERITTYCVLSMRSDSVCDSEEGEQTWETISIHPDVIEEVNVSSMRLEVGDGLVGERIALSISISEPTSNFARFLEVDSEPDIVDGKSVIEFFLNPPDVVKALPGNASRNNHESQSQPLMELLTGLRAYAEKMSPRAAITSSQSPTDCQRQQPNVEFKPKVIFVSCRSPLCVEVGKENTPSPMPKSFFADPDVSFEESAEGLGFRPTASGDRRPRAKPSFKCQTVRTPLSLRVGPDGIVERRKGSSSTNYAATPANRPINSPFSVASGLETPSPCKKSLEAPNLEAVDTSLLLNVFLALCSDEDIASESTRKASAVECPPEEVEIVTPPFSRALSIAHPEGEADQPQISIGRETRQMSKGSTSATNLDPLVEGVSRKGDSCDLDEISATETEETPQSQSCITKARKRAWEKPPCTRRPVSSVEEVQQMADVYDLNEISDTEDADHQPEVKRANLSTFEHFVEENKLELRRKGKREVSETGGSDLTEDIVAVLGSAAKRPLRGCRRSVRLAKQAEKRGEAVPLDGKDSDSGDEDPDTEVLAGSMDVMRNQAALTLSPLLNTPTAPLVPSQEDLLRDENSAGENEISTSYQSNDGGRGQLVLRQCSLVQNSRTPLESARSLHPGPENIDAAGLLKVVSPPHTPPRALIEVHPDKKPGETVYQLSVESLLESPERARRTAVASNDEIHAHLLPVVIPKALSPQIEEDFIPKSGEDIDSVKHKEGRPDIITSVDLDDSKSSLQQPTPAKSTKRVTIDADVFVSPIERPPSSTRRSRRQSRVSTTVNTTVTTTITTDANSTLEDSQMVNRSAPSPMVMSPFQRLEAAVQALESKEKGDPELPASSTDLKTSKRLWDTTATYLADESPCLNAVGVLTPDDKPPPPPGGLIVPAFGNKYFSIAAKARIDRKSTGKEEALRRDSTKSRGSPSRGRRFFASTFAERNRREVEKRFFEVIQKKTANVKDGQKKKKMAGGQQRRKSMSKKQAKKDGESPNLQLSLLEESDGVEKEEGKAFQPPKGSAGAGDDDDSGCRLQSRPAIRRAAAIARSRILETSLQDLNFNDRSPLPSPISVVRKAAKIEGTETAAVRAPGSSSTSTSRRPTLGLFAPTPNTSGVYDFTLSEDDELVKGLPRLGSRKTKGVLKGPVSLLATTPEHSSQPIISAGLITDIDRCIGVVFSTLNIVESEFSNRLNQLRDQVEEIQRLLRCWQQRHPYETEAEEAKREENRVHL
ncbi:Synaptonemal complex protein 2 [Taenia crassiceps]|uniref:Synaptonemal complex protein 2 n=1 Tax=Taenia crassiceps TaxID=6207 RepID=A0ABR4Q7T5_9CEST